MSSKYIIGRLRLNENKFRTFYGKLERVSKGIAYGMYEKDSHIKSQRKGFEIPVKDILLDLGTDAPFPGKVYGIDVAHRFQGRRVHDYFGPIAYFYKPKKNVGEILWDAFDDAASILEKAKMPRPDDETCIWEVCGPEPKTKWAGFYKHSANVEKMPHRFSIKPESVPMNGTDVMYVIFHEYAHWLHANHLTSTKVNAAWIRLFNTSIKVQVIGKDQSNKILENMLASGEMPSNFKTGLDEKDRLAFNWIVRSIKTDKAVSIRELDYLYETGNHQEIRDLWPRVGLNKKDLRPIVSEYATVSYKELLAEAFAFYFTKRKLPEGVTALLEKTLKRVEC